MNKITTMAMLLALTITGCSDGPEVLDFSGDDKAAQGGKTDSSAHAVFLDFEWDGQVVVNSCFNPNGQVESQVLYTVGQFNGDNSVGRLDKLEVTQVETNDTGDGCTISYHARMPVAWGKLSNIPTSYELILPKDMRSASLDRFVDAYNPKCVDFGAHDVTAGIMWYYFRPARSGCNLADEDVMRMQANVFDSPIGTTGKFPEYHMVWEDKRLEVVAIFGKYEDDATSGDAGISAYNSFVREIQQELRKGELTTEPAEIPNNPGVDVPETTFTAVLPDGNEVVVRAFLIDSVKSASSEFWDKYESLTPTADFIVYNGHAGLGSNIRKLAQKGVWKTGQYTIVFMNGCDTYAYVDSALNDAHAAVNSDDPEGTKYVDIVANAMPSFFRSMSSATMAMLRGLLEYDAPKTYEQIFKNIDRAEIVLVSNEHDNVFHPGMTDGGTDPAPEPWAGLNESGTVTRDQEARFVSPILEAGRYEFTMSGDGDADLYVRMGEDPTTDLYDCRPWLEGSVETCHVDLPSNGKIHVMVVGWALESNFQLVGERL